MRINRAVLIPVISILFATAKAEIGDKYEDAVRKHGAPLAKMSTKDGTVYLFQAGDDVIREVYNLEGVCIESGFGSAEPPPEPEPPPPEPEPMPPPPEPEPVPISLPEPAKRFRFELWLPLLLLPAATATILFIRKKNRDDQSLPSSADLMDSFTPRKSKKEKSDSYSAEEFLKSRNNSKNRQHHEASLRLSRNEMFFFKALHEALLDEYMVTFHVSLDRVVDISDPSFAENMPAFKRLKPVAVDFVLHNPEDTSIVAAILLHDPKTEQIQKINRLKFLQKVLKENGIQLILFHVNFEYDPAIIKDTIHKTLKGGTP